ncbi:hypothetical protein OPIT5_02895 [Opitutaceae bacterium TAV5]|nr:hypothetical protein OPIT5_02895 [Opitutaceae bacterium TAV5]
MPQPRFPIREKPAAPGLTTGTPGAARNRMNFVFGMEFLEVIKIND